MSPLRSSTRHSTIYIHSNKSSNYSSRSTTSKHPEYGSGLSTEQYEGPQPKKQKLKHEKTNLPIPPSTTYITSAQKGLHSSDEEYEPKLITSTTKTKKKYKTATKKQTQKTKQSALSQTQKDLLKSAAISLQEFLNLYNNVPNKLRSKEFYAICKTYLHNVAKTKTSIEDKKAMFLSLPQAIKTSFSLFELMFKQESIVLSNITSGKTAICNLQNSIDILLTFFPPSYIQRQMPLFVKHQQSISPQEKLTISACRKNLRQLEKQSKILLQSSEETCSTAINKSHEDNTSTLNDDQQAPKQTYKHKQNIPQEAQEILDSLANDTIDSNDIVTSRKKLVLLRVDRQSIRRAFDKFKNRVSVSQRPDKDYILCQLKKAVAQTSKIKINRLPFSDNLQNLYDQALAGTLPLHCIKELRDLMFKENSTAKASSSFRNAKIALIKHNKDKESAIKDAFEQAHTQSLTLSNTFKHLQTKIKEGNLKTTQFTSMYNSIPQSDRTGTLSKMCSKYIKSQLKNVISFKDKIKLFRELPQSLQKSHSIISLIFPNESTIMSSIRNGKLPSSDIKVHLTQLLQIINIHHLKDLINQYVTIKKHLTPNEKLDIAKCRKEIKILQQTPQPEIDTHTLDANKSQYQQQKNDMQALPCVEDEEYASTSTHPSNTSLIPTTSKQTKSSIEYEKDEGKQVTLITQYDQQPTPPTTEASTSINSNTHISEHEPSSWPICSQTVSYEIPSNILEHTTDSPSPQPSTSYSIENSYKTPESLSLEQISKVSQELQQETDNFSQLTEWESTSQSYQHKETIDTQYTHANEFILDCELPPVHEDFLGITDMSASLNYEDFHQLIDKVEYTIPLKEMTPEEFFDFSHIDNE